MIISEAVEHAKRLSEEYAKACEVLTTSSRIEQHIKEREAQLVRLLSNHEEAKATLHDLRHKVETTKQELQDMIQRTTADATATAHRIMEEALAEVEKLKAESQVWNQRLRDAKQQHDEASSVLQREKATLQHHVDEVRSTLEKLLARVHG